jgi:hypothetical protein
MVASRLLFVFMAALASEANRPYFRKFTRLWRDVVLETFNYIWTEPEPYDLAEELSDSQLNSGEKWRVSPTSEET